MFDLCSNSPLPATGAVLSSKFHNTPQEAAWLTSAQGAAAMMKAADKPAATTTTKALKGKKRTSDESASNSTQSGNKSKKQKASEDKANSRWPWINKRRPDIVMKGTKIEAFNCGGSFFKATGTTLEARLDKLEAFFEECGDGDEMSHPK